MKMPDCNYAAISFACEFSQTSGNDETLSFEGTNECILHPKQDGKQRNYKYSINII